MTLTVHEIITGKAQLNAAAAVTMAYMFFLMSFMSGNYFGSNTPSMKSTSSHFWMIPTNSILESTEI